MVNTFLLVVMVTVAIRNEESHRSTSVAFEIESSALAWNVPDKATYAERTMSKIGIPVCAFPEVCDKVCCDAAGLIDNILQTADPDVVKPMQDGHCTICMIGRLRRQRTCLLTHI